MLDWADQLLDALEYLHAQARDGIPPVQTAHFPRVFERNTNGHETLTNHPLSVIVSCPSGITGLCVESFRPVNLST
ncbi:MAG: hypothetical protein H0T45_01685 [Pyrinomonadaceae bacterium]|nr:hypothetical protein [Pyrinomonadaceae bacterium]